MAVNTNLAAAGRPALALLAALLAACGGGQSQRPASPEPGARAIPGATALPRLPDSTGLGPHVLALETSPRGELWVGTYGRGIYVLRRGSREWERIAAGDSTGISWDFVNSIAFGADADEVWYGTVGNGYGVSRDGGKTWRNWQFRQLGPEFQYVAPDGIRVHDGDVYVATADGLRISTDDGASWLCVGGQDGIRGGSPEREGACRERTRALPTEYLLALDVAPDGTIWVGHPRGLSYSSDGGRSWKEASGEALRQPVREVLATRDGIWALTESHVLRDSADRRAFHIADPKVPGWRALPGAPRALVPQEAPPLPVERMGNPEYMAPRMRRTQRIEGPAGGPTVITSYGAVVSEAGTAPVVQYIAAAERYRPSADLWAGAWFAFTPLVGAAGGLQRVLAGEAPLTVRVTGAVALPEPGRHLWLRRPVADTGANRYIDGTYRYGSTMGGNFQQHQGVEFNNAAGTPVHAVADGLVVFAGPAEAGANTVAIRHDRGWEDQQVFTTYYHNTALEVRTGQRVRAGDLIARVGNTGRATNDHLHLEVHVAPTTDSAAIINPAERFPPFTRNPQLWLEPVGGTGVVAGRVLDSAGQPVPGARVYGLVVPYPEETPFSFAETYRERAHPDPAYGEHFAVGDVAPGDYTLGASIDGEVVWRRARVAAGMVTFVEFRPGTD
jgi:murein DD-endopeptidase MepM/ murein hydrolase activator NlpD